jgi:hypothetical protein
MSDKFSLDDESPTLRPSKSFTFDFAGKFAAIRFLLGFRDYRKLPTVAT